MENLLFRLTHIGRVIDPRYPTNLAILVWGTLSAAVMFFIQLAAGAALHESFIDAFLAAVSIVLTWIFSRELDPEEPMAAFVGPALLSAALLFLDQQFNFVLLIFLIPLVRIVNRTMGLPATMLDNILIALFIAVIGVIEGWVYMLLGAVAFLLDLILPGSVPRQAGFLLIAIALVITDFFMDNGQQAPVLPSFLYALAIIGVTVIYIPVIMRSKHMTQVADITQLPLDGVRVRSGQLLLLGAGCYAAFWEGNTGVLDLLPLWTAIAGVSLYSLIRSMLSNR